MTKVEISENKIYFHKKVLAFSLVLRVTVGFAKVATGLRIPAKPNICYRVLLQKGEFFFEKLINIKVVLFLIHELFR